MPNFIIGKELKQVQSVVMRDRMAISKINHPRISSDFCIDAVAEVEGINYAVCAAIDTIGRPRRRNILRVIKRVRKEIENMVSAIEPGEDMEELDDEFIKTMRAMNRLTRETGRKEKGFFGFCFAFALRIGQSVRIHWMGDCRSYHFMPREGENALSVSCLTRDNNKLTAEILKKEEENRGAELEMLKNEMIELSRQLECYLGIGNDTDFAKILASQSVDLDLAEGDMLMLTTDGILMPVVRSEVANAGFKLTRDRLYLEQWFARYVENGEYLLDYKGMQIWETMLEDLKTACIKYTSRRRRRYRDDMAVVCMS